MNFLKGKVNGGAFRSAEGTSLPLPSTRGVSEGSPIVYGIRPEHFQLNGGVPARVNVIEPTGSETQVMAEFAGTPIIAAFRERVSARPGETIQITPDPAMVHLFDAATGLRLSA
jgi:multiple sugar transport system ATP-binding protein